MFFRPSRVFPLQWPLSGTMRLTVTCSITPAFARSAAAALSPPWQVCCIPARAHRHVFACKPIRIILWIFTEIPDPDVEFTCGYKRCFENAKRGANCSNVCMRHDDSVDAVCKRGFSCINQNHWETRLLSCSASASRRVLISSLSGGQMKFPPYIANVEGREIPQDLSPLHSPIGRGGEPRALAPIEGSSKKDWLSMDGREAWQSVPKEASLGRRRICRDVCENTGGSLFLTLFDSPSFNFWPAGESGGPKMITQKSPKWLFALPPRPALSSERKPLI